MSNPWFESEGDNWYTRNKESLGSSFDVPLFLLKLYSIKPEKVLEIGAANGYRLAKIHEQYSAEVTAIEPSEKAVEDGRANYPVVRFIRSTYEDCDLKEKFDLIIVNFVFHWVYRESLYKCVYKIDNMLKDGGCLLIGDFGPEYFFKRKYHHLKDADFYTWKMLYSELFTKSGKYLELAKLRYVAGNHKFISDININNMCTAVLLSKKDMFIEI